MPKSGVVTHNPADRANSNIVISAKSETGNPTTRNGFKDFCVSCLSEMTITTKQSR